MANLRAGILRTGRPQITRLESRRIHVWANTWNREVHATLDKDGRLDIRVNDREEAILDVCLPANEGEDKDTFTPGIKMSPEMERGMLESLLTKYFGEDMAKSLLITNGIKGPLLEDNGREYS